MRLGIPRSGNALAAITATPIRSYFQAKQGCPNPHLSEGTSEQQAFPAPSTHPTIYPSTQTLPAFTVKIWDDCIQSLPNAPKWVVVMMV